MKFMKIKANHTNTITIQYYSLVTTSEILDFFFLNYVGWLTKSLTHRVSSPRECELGEPITHVTYNFL